MGQRFVILSDADVFFDAIIPLHCMSDVVVQRLGAGSGNFGRSGRDSTGIAS